MAVAELLDVLEQLAHLLLVRALARRAVGREDGELPPLPFELAEVLDAEAEEAPLESDPRPEDSGDPDGEEVHTEDGLQELPQRGGSKASPPSCERAGGAALFD